LHEFYPIFYIYGDHGLVFFRPRSTGFYPIFGYGKAGKMKLSYIQPPEAGLSVEYHIQIADTAYFFRNRFSTGPDRTAAGAVQRRIRRFLLTGILLCTKILDWRRSFLLKNIYFEISDFFGKWK
jgi:hypothetical protein